jgi:thioredoxin-like negative regulator of GroEL
MAPTLYQLEEQYRDKVNFVMVNGDDPNNWGLIEKLGVDAIPHMAMIEADGTVDTALIGPVPKQWLIQDIDTLIENANIDDNGETQRSMLCTEEEGVGKADGTILSSSTICANKDVSKKPLPFQMLDAFASRPNERQIEGAILSKEEGR